ncbi:hypothetical protein HMN09_00551500 [Mycena chlorophos]|uniref:Proteophosphoglycan 5 n=1 Tax=Mycena chlorophos TaxID=658473 RepID=A0A8H6TC76_MYCCL|nr:hypothetical protein HMN09_00551500 [Mycena chlorophos]
MAYNLVSSEKHHGWRRYRYRSIVFWGTGVLLAGLILLALEQNGNMVSSRFTAGGKPVPNEADAELEVLLPPPPKKRAYIRAASLGTEGFGSILQHFKACIVFSTALSSNLILSWDTVDVNDVNVYSTSKIYNERIPKDELTGMDLTKACRIQDHISHGERIKLTRALCNGEGWAAERMDGIAMQMNDCTSIIDLENDELIQDMNGCVMPWVRERLSPHFTLPPPLNTGLPPTRPVTVGVHIRWGDTAIAPTNSTFDPATHNFYGSMTLPHISQVLADLVATYPEHGVQITIAMERADARVLDWLELSPGTYTLLDSMDVLGDLQQLSANDVLLLGESSYGVLAHLVAPGPGLTIVEGGGLGKFSNTSGWGRHVVYMEKYTPSSVRLLEVPVGS